MKFNKTKYTRDSWNAILTSKELAKKNLNCEVRTHHLMLAIIETNDSIRTLLKNLGCDINRFKLLALSDSNEIYEEDAEEIDYGATVCEILWDLEKNLENEWNNCGYSSKHITIVQIFRELLSGSFYTSVGFIVESGMYRSTLEKIQDGHINLEEKIQELTNDNDKESSKSPEFTTEDLKDLYYISSDSDESFDITKYAQNMNINYINGKYDKCSMRDNEINRMCEILLRKNKNNPVLIGKAGVGKTAIVEGLAEKIVELKKEELNGGSHHPLADKIILNLNLTTLISGSKYRGDFEERIQKIFDIVTKNPNIILFIDEIHMIVGLNNSADCQGTVSLSQMLKQPLSRGDISVIGATTEDEYQIITQDKAMDRRFSPVKVQEFTRKQMTKLLSVIAKTYEDYHKVTIPKQVMTAALKYSNDYYTERVYPDKLIDIIDETASRIRLNNYDKDKITMTEEDVKKTVMNQLGILIIE